MCDLFSGISGFRNALQNLGKDNGFEVECVGWSEIDKQAKQSYRALYSPDESGEIDMGDIVNFNDNRINELDDKDIDLLTGGFPCFKAGTPVMTSNGWKNIEDIEIGDMVLAQDKHYREVENTMVKDADKLIKMHVDGIFDDYIYATPNHPFYARKYDRERPRLFSQPEYVPLEELRVGDLVGYPMHEGAYSMGSVQEWKLIGMLLYYQNYKVLDNCIDIIVPRIDAESTPEERANKRKYQELEIYLEDTFLYCLYDDKDTLRYRLMYSSLNKILTEAFTNGLPNNFCYELESSRKRFFVDGFCCKMRNKNLSCPSVEIAKAMIPLIREARHSLVTYHTIDEGKTPVVAIVDKDNCFAEEGVLWCPIDILQEIEEKCEVYNLSVEGNPSYNVNGICVHNCQSFSVLGNRKGFDDEKGRGLMFFQIARLLKHRIDINKPIPFLMLENVKNLVVHDNGNTFKKIQEILSELGYNVYWDVFNCKDFYQAQTRNRVAIFATLKDVPNGFHYEKKNIENVYKHNLDKENWHVETADNILDVIQSDVDPKYFISESFKKYVLMKISPRVPTIKGLNPEISPTLTVSQALRCGNEAYFTKAFLENPCEWWEKEHTYEECLADDIRKLTPHEKMLLQGFSKDMTDKLINAKCSDSNIYKRAGNAVNTSMFYAIFYYLFIDQNLINEIKED